MKNQWQLLFGGGGGEGVGAEVVGGEGICDLE